MKFENQFIQTHNKFTFVIRGSRIIVTFFKNQNMFDETRKYKNSGHFFFKKGDNLKQVTKNIPDLPGVYYIVRLAGGRIEIVNIGKSGPVQQNGKIKDHGLKSQLNNKQDGIDRQEFFESRILKENIDALDIYWFVTFDSKTHDLPGFVEGLLIQRFFEMYGRLPLWNQEL